MGSAVWITDLERYTYLIGRLDTDETLFYKVVMSDPARFLPIQGTAGMALAGLLSFINNFPIPKADLPRKFF